MVIVVELFAKALSWGMLAISIFGFARLMYYEKWGRALFASVLSGISLYMMIFV